jgi:hypothetical protein
MMFRDIFTEGKKGATNAIENKIENYFKKKGYYVGALVNYHSDNEVVISVYKSDSIDDFENGPVKTIEISYDNKTPKKIFDEVKRQLD